MFGLKSLLQLVISCAGEDMSEMVSVSRKRRSPKKNAAASFRRPPRGGHCSMLVTPEEIQPYSPSTKMRNQTLPVLPTLQSMISYHWFSFT